LKLAQEEGVEAEAYKNGRGGCLQVGQFRHSINVRAILAHFDSWTMPRLFASAAEALKENGVVIVEEMDRVHAIFMSRFKDFIVENPKPEELSLSIYAGYDVVKGYLRTFIRVRDWKSVTLP